MDIGAVIASRVLAVGPVATVYAGHLAGDEIAVKLFAGPFDRETTSRLNRERRALESVRSVRSILCVDDVIEDVGGRSGVRMELCSGSLAGVSGALTVPNALAIGSAVATALAAAHGVGVVHGGVTPSNVLYRRTGEIVLADFGLTLRERFPRDPVAALEYTAPETLRDGTRSVASDLYGLGAVLHTVLTGAPPFPRGTGQAPAERILQVLRVPVPPVAGVPTRLSDVVSRLMAKDPADRPADAAGVAEVFEELLRVPAEPEGDFDFDDFTDIALPAPAGWAAPAPAGPAPAPAAPAPATPTRTLIHTTDAQSVRRRRPWRPVLLVGAGVLAAGLAVVPMLLGSDSVDTPRAALPVASQSAPAQLTTPTATGPVKVELAAPTDQGHHVELTWRADGDLDFVVVVAGEQIDTMVLVAHRDHAMRVPVDPDRKYCFQIRASDGRQVYTSEPVAIRGARCKL